MAVYPPPTNITNIYNRASFETSNDSLDLATLDTRYLKLYGTGYLTALNATTENTTTENVTTSNVVNLNATTATITNATITNGTITNLTTGNPLLTQCELIEFLSTPNTTSVNPILNQTLTWTTQVISGVTYYNISTSRHFICLMNNGTGYTGQPVNMWTLNYIQMCDVNLNGITCVPIGNTTTNFTGSYNGNGLRISNWSFNNSATSYVGLFGYINGATLKNITMDGAGSITASQYIGFLCGSTTGNVTITNINISVTGDITSVLASSSYIGGLIGYIGIGTVSVTYLYNNIVGSFSGYSLTAGIIAYVYSLVTGTFAHLVNNMTGSVTNTSGNICGGIFGYFTTTASNCLNKMVGNLTSTSGGTLAGIVAQTNNTAVLYDCTNAMRGNIISNGSFGSGGICGYAASLYGCINSMTGNITCSSSSAPIGGLIGSIGGSCSINYSVNAMNGNISSSSSSTNYLGGLAGSNTGAYTLTMNNCYVCMNGNIISTGGTTTCTGGLIGYLGGTSIVAGSNCIVSGNTNITTLGGSSTYNWGWNGTPSINTTTGYDYRTTYGLKVFSVTPSPTNTTALSTAIASSANVYYYPTASSPYNDFPMMYNDIANTFNHVIYYCYPTYTNIILTKNSISYPVTLSIKSANTTIHFVLNSSGTLTSDTLYDGLLYPSQSKQVRISTDENDNNTNIDLYSASTLKLLQNGSSFASFANSGSTLSTGNFTVGKSELRNDPSNLYVLNSNQDSNYSSAFALYQGSSGNTVLNCASGQQINFKVNNGSTVFSLNSTTMGVNVIPTLASTSYTGNVEGTPTNLTLSTPMIYLSRGGVGSYFKMYDALSSNVNNGTVITVLISTPTLTLVPCDANAWNNINNMNSNFSFTSIGVYHMIYLSASYGWFIR